MKTGNGPAWLVVILGAACGGTAQTAPPPGKAPAPPAAGVAQTPPPPAAREKVVARPDSENPAVAERFERYREQFKDAGYPELVRELRLGEPRKAPLGFDPKTARYYPEVTQGLGFTPEETRALDILGFVSLDPARPQSMASAYYDIYTHDLPVLVTTDSILDALHRSFDKILKHLETVVFAPTLESVLAAAHAEVKKHIDERPPEPLATSLADVDVYLSVARNLLAGAGAPGTETRAPRYTREPELGILVHSVADRDAEVARFLSAIATTRLESETHSEFRGGRRQVDYSQFIPRGHYTETNELKRYFRAMMWIGRADTGFLLSAPRGDSGIVVDLARERRGAAVLSRVLVDSGGAPRLAAVSDVIDFLVGAADNLGPAELDGALRSAGLASLADFDDGHLGSVFGSLTASSRQQILSQRVPAPEEANESAEAPGLFQLFGQRFALDSFIESKVVFDAVRFKGDKPLRKLPSGLDVMAALGSQEAVRLLEPSIALYHYSANLLAAAKVANDISPEGWTGSGYARWLDALRVLDDVPAEPNRFPAAMKSEAWERKQLRAALASWAELRHDTLLYAKQSYGSTLACEYPEGFVEPYPEFFDKIRDLAHAAGERLAKLDTSFLEPKTAGYAAGMRDGQAKFFRRFESILGFLAALARKELAAQPFSEAEQVFLKSTIDRHGGSGPPRYDGWYPALLYGGDKATFQPTIADVHTYPGEVGPPRVLEVGTGRTHYVVVAIDNEKDRAVYVGPAFSYFEFSVPPEQRLTDEAWTSLVTRDGVHPPDWERTFQMPPRPLSLPATRNAGFPMTKEQTDAYTRATRQYQTLMSSYPRHATPAERLRYDKRIDEVRSKMLRARGCGCPPGDADCPCLMDSD